MIEGAAGIFDSGKTAEQERKGQEGEKARLERKVGQLVVEVDRLQKSASHRPRISGALLDLIDIYIEVPRRAVCTDLTSADADASHSLRTEARFYCRIGWGRLDPIMWRRPLREGTVEVLSGVYAFRFLSFGI